MRVRERTANCRRRRRYPCVRSSIFLSHCHPVTARKKAKKLARPVLLCQLGLTRNSTAAKNAKKEEKPRAHSAKLATEIARQHRSCVSTSGTVSGIKRPTAARTSKSKSPPFAARKPHFTRTPTPRVATLPTPALIRTPPGYEPESTEIRPSRRRRSRRRFGRSTSSSTDVS